MKIRVKGWRRRAACGWVIKKSLREVKMTRNDEKKGKATLLEFRVQGLGFRVYVNKDRLREGEDDKTRWKEGEGNPLTQQFAVGRVKSNSNSCRNMCFLIMSLWGSHPGHGKRHLRYRAKEKGAQQKEEKKEKRHGKRHLRYRAKEKGKRRSTKVRSSSRLCNQVLVYISYL